MRQSRPNLPIAIAVCFAAMIVGRAASGAELNLGAWVRPAPTDAGVSQPGYYVWCGAPTQTADGKCHLFFSRWPVSKGFSPGWAIYSEIAYAVADKPAGPYKFVDVALPPRGAKFWDGACTHNPNVLQKDGKFYLFYMGNHGDGTYPVHRNNQRIGVAVADRPQGPWKRFDKPIIDVSRDPGAFDSLCVSNPAATVRPDGRILLIYKGVQQQAGKVMGGRVRYGAAIADRPEGPYTKLSGHIFESSGDGKTWMLAEDPFIWYSAEYGNQYYALARDVVGRFSGVGGGIAMFCSPDGLNWKPTAHPKVLGDHFLWADGKQSLARIERPALLFSKGKPVMLFGATDGYHIAGHISFNVHIPLKPQGEQ